MVFRVIGEMSNLAPRPGADLLQDLPRDALDVVAQMRAQDRASVAERRIGDRHLQRVGLQVALPDREVDVVAALHGRSVSFSA